MMWCLVKLKAVFSHTAEVKLESYNCILQELSSSTHHHATNILAKLYTTFLHYVQYVKTLFSLFSCVPILLTYSISFQAHSNPPTVTMPRIKVQNMQTF